MKVHGLATKNRDTKFDDGQTHPRCPFVIYSPLAVENTGSSLKRARVMVMVDGFGLVFFSSRRYVFPL